MSALLQKIKILYKKALPQRSVFTTHAIYPKRDWNRLVGSSLVILLVGALLAFYLYMQIDAGTIFVVDQGNTQSQITIKTTLLKQVVDDINLREANLEAIKQNQGIPADPSK